MGRRRDGCHSSGSSNEPVRHTPRLLPPAASCCPPTRSWMPICLRLARRAWQPECC